mmetsp:Transcript_28675/g.60973  ORF Transcript_28675/g.60973 Transcript_28675/m.60973 type:complete len:206 (+) Transcript_28675:2157-2774(+)
MYPHDVLSPFQGGLRHRFYLAHYLCIGIRQAVQGICRGVLRVGYEGRKAQALARRQLPPGPLLRLHRGPGLHDHRSRWWNWGWRWGGSRCWCWRWQLGSSQTLGIVGSLPGQLLAELEQLVVQWILTFEFCFLFWRDSLVVVVVVAVDFALEGKTLGRPLEELLQLDDVFAHFLQNQNDIYSFEDLHGDLKLFSGHIARRKIELS